MPQPVILNRKDLRARNWTHSQIRTLAPTKLIKTGRKGRPRFGYKLSTVVKAERARAN